MRDLLAKPWLKALSGLSINFSAALYAVPFIGPNISFPKDILDFAILTMNIMLGTMFLLLTVWFEKELEK